MNKFSGAKLQQKEQTSNTWIVEIITISQVSMPENGAFYAKITKSTPFLSILAILSDMLWIFFHEYKTCNMNTTLNCAIKNIAANKVPNRSKKKQIVDYQ